MRSNFSGLKQGGTQVMGRNRYCYGLLVLLAVVLAAASGFAAEAGPLSLEARVLPAGARPAPVEVRTGIYFNRITGVDPVAGTFGADAYVYFYCDARDSEAAQLNDIEFVNGEVEILSPVTPEEYDLLYDRGGKIARQVFRVRGIFHAAFDLRAYPLDRQDLTLAVEHKSRTAAEVFFVPDAELSAVDEQVLVPGFEIAGLSVRAEPHVYRTHFGNIDNLLADGSLAAPQPYSRVTYTVGIERQRGPAFWNYLYLPFLIVLVVVSAIFIGPRPAAAGSVITAGGLLALLAANLLAGGNLTGNGCVTLSNAVFCLSYLVVAALLLASLLAVNLVQGRTEDGIRRVLRWNRWSGAVVFLLYLAGIICSVWPHL